MKYLIWLVVAWAVVVWMQRARKNVIRRAREAAQAAAAAGADFGGGGNASGAGMPPSPAIEQMVQCAQCGIHFPNSEAVQARGTGKLFCCVEHRELHVVDAGAHPH